VQRDPNGQFPYFSPVHGMGDGLAKQDRAWGVAVLALGLALLLPLFVTEVPPLGDYLNHLARAFVLSALPGDAVLGRMYAAQWSVIPNLGLDLVMPPLIRFQPVHVVGRAVIGAAALLPVLGAIAYQRAMTGRPARAWWSLGVCLTAYSGLLLYGFLNFQLGIGLALLFAAAWLAWRESRPSLAIGGAVIGAPILFACHLMGLVFFGLLIGSAELAQLMRFQADWKASPPWPGLTEPSSSAGDSCGTVPQWEEMARSSRTMTGNTDSGRIRTALWPFHLRQALRRGAVLLLVFAMPAVLYEVSALSDLGGDGAWWPATEKVRQLNAAFIGYNAWLDRAATAVAFGVPVVALLLRRGRFPAPASIAVLGLAVIYAAAPYAWKGTSMLDTRFAVMLAVMMFAGFVPDRWPRWVGIGVGGLVAALFLARLGVLIAGWQAQGPVLAAMRDAMAPLRPGQTVMVAEASPEEAPAYWAADPHALRLSNGVTLSANLGALALIEHRAWWPFEFDSASQQPIRTREPYETLAVRAEALPDRTRLLGMDLCGFDDVLLTNAEAVPSLPPERFRRLAGSGFAVLYAVSVCDPR
jgi:hypothetical protein